MMKKSKDSQKKIKDSKKKQTDTTISPASSTGKTKKPFVFNTRAAAIAAMRRAFRYYKVAKEVWDEAKEEYWIPSTAKKKTKNTPEKKRRVRHVCATCNNKFPRKQCVLDHKNPIVDPKVGFVSLDVWADRHWCAKANLQVLCEQCHDVKTAAEGGERAKTRKKKKADNAAVKR